MKTPEEVKQVYEEIRAAARSGKPVIKADGRVFIGGRECKSCTEKWRGSDLAIRVKPKA